MTAADTDRRASFLRRFWIYQAERFPLGRSTVLLAAFGSASVNVSALLGGRPLPGFGTYLAAFVVLMVLFFQLRAADEVKDAEDDRRYRPERAIPRGLVDLREIVLLAVGLVPVAALAAGLLAPAMLILLAIVWIWLGLMSIEFGVGHWLRARPILYLVSHMAIMPLMDLFVTGAEWLVRAGTPPHGLWYFLALSFMNGSVLEIGRKLYAPESERPGVETYTAMWGIDRAALVWLGCVATSFALLVGVGFAVGAPLKIAAVGALAFAATVAVGVRFMRAPTPAHQKAADTAAGLWVLVCYVTAGYLPLLGGAA